MKEWYAIYTKVNAENRVALSLRQNGIEVYLPVIHPSTHASPLFPGYIFAQLDLQKGNPALWRWVPGVRRVVSYGDEPIALPSEFIRTIQRKLAQLNDASKERSTFQTGDLVRIMEGPFKDLVAVFDGPMEPSKRVRVFLTVLGRYHRLRLDAASLEPASKVAPTIAKPKRRRRTRGHGRRINYRN